MQYCYLKFGLVITVQMLDQVKSLGFLYATRAGISIGIDDMVVPSEKAGLVREAEKEVVAVENQYQDGAITHGERYNKIIEIWSKVTEKVSDEMFHAMEEDEMCIRDRDWECLCGKYKRMKHRGVICDKCGVEVTLARVRRERLGHIELASQMCIRDSCRGSFTGRRSTTPGARRSMGLNCVLWMGPLSSMGLPNASTTRPIKASPTGTDIMRPVRRTSSPSLISVASPSSTAPTWSSSRFMAMPATSCGNSINSPAITCLLYTRCV